MHTITSGAAFIDRGGAILAADPGFLAQLGLGAGDPTAALRARAEAVPELRALLAADGPAIAQVRGEDGAILEVERVPGVAGALLFTRSPHAGEWLEHAIRSHGLTRLAAGVAHDIKNPLNAMALQLALLTDKLASAGDAAASSASHLAALREQVGRVNEVVRRFLDVASLCFATAPPRRRIELVADAPRGSVRTAGDPARVGRLVLGLVSRAVAETPEGGRLSVRAEAQGEHAVVRIEHAAGAPDPDTGYYTDVVAAAAESLGGDLSASRGGGTARLTLRLPRNDRS
jgi:signal transduction histidine kinase